MIPLGRKSIGVRMLATPLDVVRTEQAAPMARATSSRSSVLSLGSASLKCQRERSLRIVITCVEKSPWPWRPPAQPLPPPLPSSKLKDASHGVQETVMLGQASARGRAVSNVNSVRPFKNPRDAKIGVQETVTIGLQSAYGRAANIAASVQPLKRPGDAKIGARETAMSGQASAHGKAARNAVNAKAVKSQRNAKHGVQVMATIGPQSAHGKAAALVAHARRTAACTTATPLHLSAGRTMSLEGRFWSEACKYCKESRCCK